MRLWRLLAVLAGALAVLVLAAALALRHFFPPERIKAVALAKLEAALGREVRIDSVSLGLRGLRLEGLEISEAPDFRAGVFVKAQSVLARWDLRALLRRRVAVSEVALDDFECNLVKDAQGRLNAATIGPSTKPGQAPAPKKASAPRAGAAAPQVGAAAASGEKIAGGEFEISVRRVKLDGGRVTNVTDGLSDDCSPSRRSSSGFSASTSLSTARSSGTPPERCASRSRRNFRPWWVSG